MEVLTTVQTIAEDQTEVASKMNTLMSDYQIRTDDIKAYDVSTFGANKFLISVVYILTQLSKLGNVFIRLQIKLARKVSLNRKLSSIFNLKVGVMGFVYGTNRRANVIFNLVSNISRKIRIKQTLLVVSGLISKLNAWGIGVVRRNITDLITLKSELFKAKRKSDSPIVINVKVFSAFYNGVPIEGEG